MHQLFLNQSSGPPDGPHFLLCSSVVWVGVGYGPSWGSKASELLVYTKHMRKTVLLCHIYSRDLFKVLCQFKAEILALLWSYARAGVQTGISAGWRLLPCTDVMPMKLFFICCIIPEWSHILTIFSHWSKYNPDAGMMTVCNCTICYSNVYFLCLFKLSCCVLLLVSLSIVCGAVTLSLLCVMVFWQNVYTIHSHITLV